MKRHLIWIIAGGATVALAVPAFAAMQPTGAPEDNGVPSEVRGNCDEAEHANDPDCLTMAVSSARTAMTPVTIDRPAPTSPSTTLAIPTSSSVTSTSRSARTASFDDRTAGSVTPSTSVADDGPGGTVPDDRVQTGVPAEISGNCDEAEHANDPNCTGSPAGVGDDSGQHGDDNGTDDSSSHSGDVTSTDDHSGQGGDDAGTEDHSGQGGDDAGTEDHSGHGGDDAGTDDHSGHGSDG